MNKKYSIGWPAFFVLISMLLGVVPVSRAQSVQTWSQPVNLSRSGTASNPSVVVDNQGVVHVFWVDKFDGHKYAQSTDNGATWTSPTDVRYPFPSKASPVLFVDASGLIYIFWLSEDNELTYSRALPEHLDVPASWQAFSRLDAPVFDFDVAMDPQGNLHLGYVKNPAPSPGVAGAFYRRLQAGTGAWSPAVQLYESSYFRSLTADQARIRVAVSDSADDKSVYVVWDERPQKRIFLAHSADGGSTWDTARDVITPQASLGFKTPFQSDVSVLNNKLLMTWQVGDPGVRCTSYSWASSDDGATWDEPVPILAESAQCPERSDFISLDPAYSVELFTVQGDLSLSAWNGTRWSNPEIQTGPSSITNPATFDMVLLGCDKTAVTQDRLFVVGCDENPDGDVWFIARQLDSLDALFPSPSAWGNDDTVVSAQQAISALTSITDDAGNIHAVWIQSSGTLTAPIEPRIQYARWTDDTWTQPAPIFSGLSGAPLNLALQVDHQHRLLLAWVNQSTGDLLFSWANSEQANLSVEWIQPVILSPSPLANSPKILVDALDRIVIAYAVPLNESRGIYMIQSTDLGITWTEPLQIFDAVAENWEMVDQPRLSMTADGKLHVLFTKYSLLGGQQPVGLYYSQSSDGGTTWTAAHAVSEQPVQWSEIVAAPNAVHRFWREKNDSDTLTYHQLSVDAGNTWNTATKLPIAEAVISAPAISLDGEQNLHLLQIVQSDVHTLQEWIWSADRWSLAESRKIGIPEQETEMPIASGITSNGNLYSLLQFARPEGQATENNILSVHRSLDANQAPKPFVATIPTPSFASLTSVAPDILSTPTVLSPLAGMQEASSPVTRNLIGLSLIVVLVLLIVVVTVPRRSSKADKYR